MNEAGLVVSAVWLEKQYYEAPQPKPDSRPYVYSGAQWVQYQLDTASTVEDVINSDLRIRVANCFEKFFVSDKQGKCVIISFIDGEMEYYDDEIMPVKALVSDIAYEKASSCLGHYEGFGGEFPVDKTDPNQPQQRFVRAASKLQSYDPVLSSPIDYAFGILSYTAEAGEEDGYDTVWSTVYDINDLTVYFRTTENPKLRQVNLASLDFSPDAQDKVLDVNADLEGDVANKFVNYTLQINRDIFEEKLRALEDNHHGIHSYSDWKKNPEKYIYSLLRYPEESKEMATPRRF